MRYSPGSVLRYLIFMSVFLVPAVSAAHVTDKEYIARNYTKREVMIPMRDGVSLYTAVFEPSDAHSRPVIMMRTPYSCAPYGDGFPDVLWKDMRFFAENEYIIVLQNVRGRYMSEGEYENIRPFNPAKRGAETDEASDTYDTAEWLVRNTDSNGCIGVTGVSYPGFYALMAALSGHPAVKAVSPQAPVFDWYMGDDAHHNGVLMLLDTYSFGGSMYREHDNPAPKAPKSASRIVGDAYGFFLKAGNAEGVTRTFSDSLEFWYKIMEHPDYDGFWQDRCPGRHLKDISPAVLVVGGMFDTDDCYGALKTYTAVREQSPGTDLHFVYGPWYHGGWHNTSYTHLGQVWIGEGTSGYYMEHIEYPFFRYYLEGKGEAPAAVSVLPFPAGVWENHECWPPEGMSRRRLYLRDGDSLSFTKPSEALSFSSYVSDPQHPVPHVGKPVGKRYREYMVEDQRFASARPDVLTFVSAPLQDTLKLEGPLSATVMFETTGSDADIIVKLIDVYPDSFRYVKDVSEELPDPGYQMGGYQMLVRGNVFRARYRNGFSSPQPLVPGSMSEVSFSMDDIAHWFLPGHRIMVQVQSSWFPLADRNPQTYVENIYKARVEDYVPAEIKVYHQQGSASYIELPVIDDTL